MKIGVFGYIGLGLFVVGVVLLVFAIRDHRKNQSFIEGATEVEGKVREATNDDPWGECFFVVSTADSNLLVDSRSNWSTYARVSPLHIHI